MQLRKQRQPKLWPVQVKQLTLMCLLPSGRHSKEKMAPRTTAFVIWDLSKSPLQ